MAPRVAPAEGSEIGGADAVVVAPYFSKTPSCRGRSSNPPCARFKQSSRLRRVPRPGATRDAELFRGYISCSLISVGRPNRVRSRNLASCAQRPLIRSVTQRDQWASLGRGLDYRPSGVATVTPSRNPSADRRFAEAFCFVPLAGVGWLCVEPDNAQELKPRNFVQKL